MDQMKSHLGAAALIKPLQHIDPTDISVWRMIFSEPFLSCWEKKRLVLFSCIDPTHNARLRLK